MSLIGECGLVILEFLGHTGVQEAYEPVLPTTFSLSQNHPNPFNTTTVMRYGLPAPADVTIRVYNLTGQLVRALLHGRMEPGYHAIEWDGKDETGKPTAAGVYLYRVVAGGDHLTRKMLVLK